VKIPSGRSGSRFLNFDAGRDLFGETDWRRKPFGAPYIDFSLASARTPCLGEGYLKIKYNRSDRMKGEATMFKLHVD
jgi:hypothetical protein